MLLITSGAYVGDELASEFGQLPPAFLPIGNKRLIYWQLEKIPKRKEVFLSIPEDYTVSNFDQKKLNENNVNIVRVPAKLSLGESVIYTLNSIGIYDQELMLLHGDTFISDFRGGNTICLGKTKSAYQWETEGDSVWAGYFSFKHVRDLIRSLVLNSYDFVSGVRSYKDLHKTDLYIDKTWLDFGHLNTYYQSKSFVTTERSFNSLQIIGDVVTKKSPNLQKINAEKYWYESLPVDLKVYTPQLLEVFDEGYKIEYQYLPSLSELFVFGEVGANVWEEIISKVFSILVGFKKHSKKGSSKDYLDGMFKNKTANRLQEFEKQTGFSINEKIVFNRAESESLMEIYRATLEKINQMTFPEEVSLLHGDMCFSNMLYDFRRGNFKLIDPRGMSSDNEVDIYGSWLYDVAKFFHSVIGCYDWIVAGYYNLEIAGNNINFSLDSDERREQIGSVATSQLLSKFGLKLNEIMPFVIHLFLSMLPLHADNKHRQKALMSNAVRLYLNWKNQI